PIRRSAATIATISGNDFRDTALDAAGGQPEVDEAGSRNLGTGESGRIEIEIGYDLLGDLARWTAEPAAEDECEVGREVAMLRIAWPFQLHADVAIRTKSCCDLRELCCECVRT